MEQIAKLIEALTPVLWFGLVLFVVIRFAPEVRGIIESARTRKFTLKIGGQELTMEQLSDQQGKLLADLQAQMKALQERVLGTQARGAQPAGDDAGQAAPPRSVLWVDDKPQNNALIVQMLMDRGIAVDTASSTQEAKERLASERYGAVVSNMVREERGQYRPEAGLTLLREVRERDDQIPFIVYCSDRKAREAREQALRLGATLVTSSPTEVSGALLRHLGMLEA